MSVHLIQPNSKPSFAHTQRWGLNRNHLLTPDILCMPFNEGGGNDILDLTGNGRNGVINGSLIWRNGLTFDGNQANYVSVPNIAAFFAGATEFTIVTETIWGSSSVDEAIFDMSETAGTNWFQNSLILFGDDVGASRNDCVSLFLGINGTIYRIESAAGIKVAGAKLQIGVTYKAPDMRMYIKGIEDANSPVTGPSAIDGGLVDDAWVGLSHAASGSRKPHQGSINYLYIDSRAHTASEMLQHAADPHSFFDTGFDLSVFGGLVVAAHTPFATINGPMRGPLGGRL